MNTKNLTARRGGGYIYKGKGYIPLYFVCKKCGDVLAYSISDQRAVMLDGGCEYCMQAFQQKLFKEVEK